MTKTGNSFLERLGKIVAVYRNEIADGTHERLALLRWQIGKRHALDKRETLPGHVTTSAIILSPDNRRTLLIDHIFMGRWQPPGGHYEPSNTLSSSAAREAIEETGISGLTMHRWHRASDIPFLIESAEVPGKPILDEEDHVHHDFQYLFVADPRSPLIAQVEEVHHAAWYPISALGETSPLLYDRVMSAIR